MNNESIKLKPRSDGISKMAAERMNCQTCTKDNREVNQMNNKEKIALINTLHTKVINSECDGEICNSVLVPVGDEVRKVINALGHNNEYIEANTEDGSIDISHIGFRFSDWWDEGEGFMEEMPNG